MRATAFASILLPLALTSQAQFYAPETEYHDKAQRLYPVELARVLAWRQNAGSNQVKEIAYTVSSGKEATSWDLKLIGAQGTPKTLKVTYTGDLLHTGPGFYRAIFRQVWTGHPWKAATKPGTIGLAQAYWRGAAETGASREETLRAAFKLAHAQAGGPDGPDIPATAGLLAHIPLPSLCGGLTLDAMLLSRAAAWLALSEQMAGETNDLLWAPILFLAGREGPAAALWTNSTAAFRKETNTPLFAFWDFFLRSPSPKEAFLFAAEAPQHPYNMGMLTYYASIHNLGRNLAEVIGPLYADKRGTIYRLHNYGHYMSYTGVGGGRILEGAWPALFRQDWLKTLAALPLGPLENRDHLKLLNIATNRAGAQVEDESLRGLSNAAAILNAGYTQGGEGALLPVATVTVRDLLNYGWEMNGLQMGARHNFVANMWGIPDLAKTIFNEATRDISGQVPFFKGPAQKTALNLHAQYYRLQMVDELFWRTIVDVQPFAPSVTDKNAARLFHKRCWLRPYELRWQAWALCKAGLCEEVPPLLETYHVESGPKANAVARGFLNWWFNESTIKEVKGLVAVRDRILKEGPNQITAAIAAVYERQSDKSPLVRAQEYEKVFWQNPDSQLENHVFMSYIDAGAWNSAKRFYRQVSDVVDKDVAFGNTLAYECWTLAWLENDRPLMQMALRDGDTGSFSAMMMAFWTLVVLDKLDEAEKQLDEMIERYESKKGADSTARVLKRFMPLIPAIADPKHPDRAKALHYFGKDSGGAVLRWILINKYKLNVEDAVRFLGGKDVGGIQHLCVLHLLKDAKGMEAGYDAFKQRTTYRPSIVMGAYLKADLLKQAIDEDKDLKPPGAVTITQAVMERLER